MSTHDPGTLYHDWRKAEVGLTQLEAEIAAEQVRHVNLSEYVAGHPHFERLMQQLSDYKRFGGSEGDVNV